MESAGIDPNRRVRLPIRVWEDVSMRRWIAHTLLLLLLCTAAGARAWAQASQPARADAAPAQITDAWARTVQALADTLVRSEQGGAPLNAALPAGTVIRRFDTEVPQDRLSLRAATAGGVVVSALGYTGAPDTVATDLARDIRQASFLPEELRAEFAIEGDAAAIKQANETAAQWVTSALQPGVQQPVALIALWQDRAAEASAAAQQAARGSMVFVLLKGRQLAAGDYVVSLVIYGDVSQIMR
jgi:hypothetical protein